MSFSYVVFTEAENRLVRAIFRKGFSHCYMLYQDRDRWIVYDPTMTDLRVFTLDDINAIVATSRVIEIETKKSIAFISFNTCVSHVKHAIGLNNPFIQTPHQLYKRLKRWDS